MWPAVLLLAAASEGPATPRAYSIEETGTNIKGLPSYSVRVFVDGPRWRRERTLSQDQAPTVELFDSATARQITLDDEHRAFTDAPLTPFPSALTPEVVSIFTPQWERATRIERLGPEELDGQKCHHLRAHFAPTRASSNEPPCGESVDDLWVSTDTRLPVRMVHAGCGGRFTTTREWRSLRIGPQPESLFEIPKGYLEVPHLPDTVFTGADEEAGTLKIIDKEVEHPERVNRALCGSELLVVTPAGPKAWKPDHPPAHGSPECLVGPESVFRGWRPLPVWGRKSDPTERLSACDAGLQGRVAAKRGKAVAGCWRAGSFGQERQVAVVLFDQQVPFPLAALVADIDGSLTFEDFPGDKDSESTWRVGDGGVLQHDGFELLFALEEPETGALRLGVAWWGGEGGDLWLLQREGDRFLMPVSGYWYSQGR